MNGRFGQRHVSRAKGARLEATLATNSVGRRAIRHLSVVGRLRASVTGVPAAVSGAAKESSHLATCCRHMPSWRSMDGMQSRDPSAKRRPVAPCQDPHTGQWPWQGQSTAVATVVRTVPLPVARRAVAVSDRTQKARLGMSGALPAPQAPTRYTRHHSTAPQPGNSGLCAPAPGGHRCRQLVSLCMVASKSAGSTISPLRVRLSNGLIVHLVPVCRLEASDFKYLCLAPNS